MVRAIPKGPEAEHKLRLLYAQTADVSDRAGGGGMLCLVDEAKYDSTVKTFGTTFDRSIASKTPKFMRGTLRVLDLKRDVIYIDLTDGSKTKDEGLMKRIAEECGAGEQKGPPHRKRPPL